MKTLLIPAYLFLPLFLFSQVKPREVDSKVTEAMVYLQGVQLISEGSVYLASGQQELVFSHLPEGIDPRTIQAAAPNDVVILSVRHFINYLKVQEQSAELKRMQDSLKLLDRQIEDLGAERQVLEAERDMILQNKSLAGSETGVKVDELARQAEFFRTRLTNIDDLWLKSKKRTGELGEIREKVQNQLAQFNARRNQPSNDVVVKVLCNREGTHRIALKYFSGRAHWIPRYDLRFNDTHSPVKIDLRADVVQNTGTDWKNVKLSLSTGNPNVSGNLPVLAPWFVYLYDPTTERYKNMNRREVDQMYAPAPPSRNVEQEEKVMEMPAEPAFDFQNQQTLADYTEVQQGATQLTYEITLAQDLPSDNQVHQVFIQKYELPAFYEHQSVPKFDRDAFLVAGVTNWESYDLVPGPASVYFEGTYLNETQLNPSITDDTLYFSLGRDRKVVITREMLKDFTKRKTIGANVEHTWAYDITVRNTKNEPILVTLKDQVPLSQSSDVTVTPAEETLTPKTGPSPQYDKETGELIWKLNLKPQESVKIRLMYTVKYPKGRVVEGL